MSIQGVQPRKRPPASIALVESLHASMQCLMPHAIMLSRERFPAIRPRTNIRSLLNMRAQVAFQIEMPSEAHSTPLDGADERRIVLPQTRGPARTVVQAQLVVEHGIHF